MFGFKLLNTLCILYTLHKNTRHEILKYDNNIKVKTYCVNSNVFSILARANIKLKTLNNNITL